MHILCLGLSHHTTPVELRERLTYSTPALKATLARFGRGQLALTEDITELVILSTCNRLEIYAVAPNVQAQTEPWFASLFNFVRETYGPSTMDMEDKFYRLVGGQAAKHLFRVVSGLDSMILGEPQVLGQVTEAYHLALEQGATGPVLSALFQTAIHAGKRARAETGISRNPTTISSVAVKLAEAMVGDLASRCVLVVGAGNMGDLAVEAFRKRGVSQITVVNRTRDRAALLAERWGARVSAFEQFTEALAEADIVLTSTGAPHIILTADLARAALAPRPHRPLVCIDIAVPRDIDPEVGRLPNVYCYDVDDLEAYLIGALAERQQEIPHVEAILAEETEAFEGWLRGLEIVPLIADLRAKAESIRRAALKKTLRRLPNLNEEERHRIEMMTEALVNKLLHDPTRRLRAEANNGQVAQYAVAVRNLFALND